MALQGKFFKINYHQKLYWRNEINRNFSYVMSFKRARLKMNRGFWNVLWLHSLQSGAHTTALVHRSALLRRQTSPRTPPVGRELKRENRSMLGRAWWLTRPGNQGRKTKVRDGPVLSLLKSTNGWEETLPCEAGSPHSPHVPRPPSPA